MNNIARYWRPHTLEEAFSLLERPGAVVVGGGTWLSHSVSATCVEAVDLQALGLDRLEPSGDGLLRIGASTRLQQIVETDEAPNALREAARRELPSTLRAQATIGGFVASGDADSLLLATLLVHDARVTVASRNQQKDIDLKTLLSEIPLGPGQIVLAVTVDTRGRSVIDRVARTTADRPIVAAAARAFEDHLVVALAGVGATPLVVDPKNLSITPEGDFRGSSEYRTNIAGVLVGRVLEAVSR